MQLPATQFAQRRLAISVRGVVQGVGFRPFVFRAASERGLSGFVENLADQVRIEVQGEAQEVAAFLVALGESCPPQARIDELRSHELPLGHESVGFEIRVGGPSAPRPTIPADLATCADCRAEIADPAERRYRYPFTNCTNCGPRWSIIRSLPYDRPRTAMAAFGLCAECQAEYKSPLDRRFHAQPIACPRCGPQIELLDCQGGQLASAAEALSEAATLIANGRILALKGLGGFQLLVDATSGAAVERLRERKRRFDKPLAVMMHSVEQALQYCWISAAERDELASPRAPILLLRKRTAAAPVRPIAQAVAPGNPLLGTMLPYTPLHHLIVEQVGRPVVCTSGNLSEEPMVTETETAIERLGHIADALLVHDRPIVRPVDDSVARLGPRGLQVLRRARGFAPLPLGLGFDGPAVLATGGHLKNTVALRVGEAAVVGSHIGDLDNAMALAVHQRAIGDLVDFYQVRPEVVACDLHPDYASTRSAERLAESWQVPLVRVQHHHAHIAAAMAEFGLEGPLTGFSWDGTGYGADGTVWGGEVLWCHETAWRRVASLKTFGLPGGDRASREPRRSALGLLFEWLGDGAEVYAREWFSLVEWKALSALLRNGRAARTSSMGRLFDAVACLLGLGSRISFEGQAAMALEYVSADDCEEAYPLPLSAADGAGLTIDWQPLLAALLEDRQRGIDAAICGARFHNALVEAMASIAQRLGEDTVVLAGGCFQNARLLDRAWRRLVAAGFRVFSPRQFPPGDGGIALGQLWLAARQTRLARQREDG